MNIYIYWYFTVYVIYKRLSGDSDFDIFATGFFSLFTTSLFYGIVLIGLDLINASVDIFNSAKGLAGFAVLVGVINYIIFLPKQRQRRMYQKYKEAQSTRMDIFTIALTFISILLLVIAIRMN